jgi:hypothetical protein
LVVDEWLVNETGIDMDLELETDLQPTFNFRQQLWGRLSGGQMVKFFAACATPIHIWVILMVLRDVSWVSGRSSTWDGIGLVAYALLFALLESLLVFAGFYLLSWLAPWRWSGEVLLARMTVIVWVFQVWAALGQLGSPLLVGMLTPAAPLLSGFSLTLYMFYFITATLAALTLVIPILLLGRYPKFETGLLNLLDRFVTLMAIYLFFDLVSIVIIVVRNI